MTVIVLERGRPSLRGRLTRWMLEVKAGVFVGSLSPRVRDELWKLVRDRLAGGAAVMVYSASNEQGFAFRSAGVASRQLIDMEGLLLVRKPA